MSLELLIGPMFAGKSSHILGTLRRHVFIGRNTLCITSSLDNRYSAAGRIVTHDKESYPATATSRLNALLSSKSFKDAQCIIIEEAQFFPDLKDFVSDAVEVHSKSVICVGLDGDSDRKPFGQILDLVPYADSVSKMSALCSRCSDGTQAIFTYRKPGAPEGQVSVGADEQYEALCRKHYLTAPR